MGLHEGSWLALGALGLHVTLVRSFGDAVQAISRFQALLRDRQDVFAIQDEHTLTIRFGPFEAPLLVRRFVAEAALASMKGLLAQFAGGSTHPLSVSLDYPAPEHAAEYRQVFGCDVYFDQSCPALVVPRALAERQQLLFQPELAEHLAKIAEGRLAWTQRAPGIAGSVRWPLRSAPCSSERSSSTI